MATDFLILELVTKGFEKAKKQFQEITKNIKQTENIMQKLQAAMLGLGLAFLFTGMAIKKFFGDLIKSAFNTFSSIRGENNELIERTNRLTAAWEFFKFSIVDALSQSGLFLLIIDAVINLVNWFNRLSPTAKKALGIMVVLAFVVGTAMMVMGMALLFVNGVVAALSTSVGILLFKSMLALFLILAAVIAIFLIWNSDMSTTSKVLLTIATVIVTILGLLLLFGAGVTLIAALWVLAIAAIFIVLALLVNKFGSVKEALIRWGQAILLVFALIADGIAALLLAPLRLFINQLIKAIKLFNELTGASIPTGGLTKILEATSPGFITGATAQILDERNRKFEQEKAKADAEPGRVEETKQGFIEAMQELGSDFFTGGIFDRPSTNL